MREFLQDDHVRLYAPGHRGPPCRAAGFAVETVRARRTSARTRSGAPGLLSADWVFLCR